MLNLGNSLGSRSIPPAFNWIVDPLVLNPFLYYDGSENVTTAGGAVSSWSERSAGTNQLDRTLAQGTAGYQPDNATEKSVDFDGSDDRLAFDVAVAQAGVLICATNNGIFAYEVDADSVDEITALGFETGYFQDLDLFAMVLLPTTTTDTQIAGVVKYLERETGATKNPTGSLQEYWRGRVDLVTPKFDALDLGGVTSLHSAFHGASSLTSLPALSLSGVTDLTYTFRDCSSLSSIASGLDVSSVTTFYQTFEGATGLTSFPLLDTSSGTTFTYCWYGCTGLTSFPALDMSSGTNFYNAWYNCTALASFPAVDMSSGTNFGQAWRSCTAMTTFGDCTFSSDASVDIDFTDAWRLSGITDFPALNLSRGTSFLRCWENNDALETFGAVTFSTTATDDINFQEAFTLWNNVASFPALNLSRGTNFTYAWRGNQMASFGACTFSDTATDDLNFTQAWKNCTQLTSFPALNLSRGTDFEGAWYNCSAMTSFGSCTFSDDAGDSISFYNAWRDTPSLATFPSDLELSRGDNFHNAWWNSRIVSFPAFDLSNATTFNSAFGGNANMVSFGACNMNLGRTFYAAWYTNTALTTFPAGVFDSWNPASVDDNCFAYAWDNCTSLTATSVENILNSLATAGVAAPSSGVDITILYNVSSGTPNIASAVATLKGLSPAWTITLNGVAQ